MTTSISFNVLPTEIASHVCCFLKQSDVSSLSRAKKSFYQLVRPILYRHLVIDTYASLILFSRTISRATYMGKTDRKWSEQESLDQTRTLNLTLDPTKDQGQPLPAVMISRIIQAIVRRCPNIAITLCFTHCRCRLSPISALETETFPGVTNLVIYVGKHDTEDSHPNDREIERCHPSAKFWRPFVNGLTFPDCSKLEIRHYWAAPPTDAILDLTKEYDAGDTDGAPCPRGDSQIGSADGLKRFESVIMECPPEINPPLLMQLLGDPAAVASNLTNLELRFCNLAHDTYAKLLYHMPPRVSRLVLLLAHDSGYRHHHYSSTEEIPHLCPLTREIGRKIVHLEFGASHICRDLFLDDTEKRSLKHNGVDTELDSQKIDGHALRETVQSCRKQTRMKYRNDRIKHEIAKIKSQHSFKSGSNSLFGGSGSANSTNQATAKAQRDTEALLDEQEEARKRLLSKTKWVRRYVAYGGTCNNSGTWSEMQVIAELEEVGIETVLVNEHLRLASQHSNGKPTIDIDIDEGLREKYNFGQAGSGIGSTGPISEADS